MGSCLEQESSCAASCPTLNLAYYLKTTVLSNAYSPKVCFNICWVSVGDFPSVKQNLLQHLCSTFAYSIPSCLYEAPHREETMVRHLRSRFLMFYQAHENTVYFCDIRHTKSRLKHVCGCILLSNRLHLGFVQLYLFVNFSVSPCMYVLHFFKLSLKVLWEIPFGWKNKCRIRWDFLSFKSVHVINKICTSAVLKC